MQSQGIGTSKNHFFVEMVFKIRSDSVRARSKAVVENATLLEPIKTLNKLSTQAQIKDVAKATIAKAVRHHWEIITQEPDAFFILGEFPRMLFCEYCKLPHLLHTTPQTCALKPSKMQVDLRIEFEMALCQINSYEVLRSYLYIESAQESEETLMLQSNKVERKQLPPFSKQTFETWATFVELWDETYAHENTFDKYLDLLRSLENEEGHELYEILLLENFEPGHIDIIKTCLARIKVYMNKNEYKKACEIMQLWEKRKRKSGESLKDFVERFDNTKMQRDKALLGMTENSYALELLNAAELDPHSLQMVQSKVTFNAKDAYQQMKNALSIVVVTNTNGVIIERGRTHNRVSRSQDRSRSNGSLKGQRLSADSMDRHSWREFNEQKNTGKNVNYYTSFYSESFEKVALFDNECEMILMSEKDIPHLKSVLGYLPKETGDKFPIKFGDKEAKFTTKVLKVPFWDGEKCVNLNVGLVQEKIPLLVGLSCLRTTDAVPLRDELSFKNGTTIPLQCGNGEITADWTAEIHYGPHHDKNKVNLSDYNENVNFIAEYRLEKSLMEDNILKSASKTFIERNEFLLDKNGSSQLRYFKPIERQGYYDIEDTDRVYLFKHDMIDNFPIIDPFCYSDIENSILKITHDRGFRGEEDLEENIKKRKVKNCRVKFDEKILVAKFNKFDPSTEIETPSLMRIITHNISSYYVGLTSSLSLEVGTDAQAEVKGENHLGREVGTIKAPGPAPSPSLFFIRSSGQIEYTDKDKEEKISKGSNCIFSIFSEKINSGCKKQGDLEPKIEIEEKKMDKIDKGDFNESKNSEEFYSQKEMHNAKKKMAPKTCVVREFKNNSKTDSSNPNILPAIQQELDKFQKYEEIDPQICCQINPTNMTLHKKGRLKGVFNIYVNNLPYAGTSEFESSVMIPLMKNSNNLNMEFGEMDDKQRSEYYITINLNDFKKGLKDFFRSLRSIDWEIALRKLTWKCHYK